MNIEQNAPIPERRLTTAEKDINQSHNRSQARLLRTLLIISIATDVGALVASAVGGFGWQYLLPISSLLAFALGSLFALNRGYLLPARILLPSSLFVVITYIIAAPPGYGLHDINLLAYAVVITLASLTLGQRGAFAFTFLIILSIFGIGIAEMRGILVSPTSSLTLPVSPIAISIVVLAITFIQRALINLLNVSVEHAQSSEKEVAERNSELQRFNEGLEKLVQERTLALENANAKIEYRAAQFEAIAQVSRTISSTQDLNTLLPQIASVISRLFGFYHVGIFLLDARGEYAVLSAANSDGGQRMLARDHRLKVGETGIVGYVTATGNPRVALDTGADAVFFNNPDLPGTHSEMSLPLNVSGHVIGVLDVQSTERNAFAEEDVSILSTLADQVGIAIQNSRQYEETRRALIESESLSRQFIEQAWQQFTKSRNLVGIRHTGAKATILYAKNGEAKGESWSNKEQAEVQPQSASLVLPIKLRGETIGSVEVRSPDNRVWDQDELDIVTAIIERAAVALENSRLLTESQKRAAKERAIGEISAKISAQSDIDQLLKTAAQELGRSLPKANISIQFKKEDEAV